METTAHNPRGEGRSPLFAAPSPVKIAHVRKTLDRAVAAAFVYARPEQVPPLTPIRWVYRLAGLYHLTHSTPSLLELARARFAAAGRPVLAEWAHVRAREESHHDVLALRDLRDLGHDGERVVRAIRPATAIRMLEFFTSSAHAPDPIGCVGYAYAVERLAMTVREPDIRAVEAILPPGTRATRCLRVHSAAGSDSDHVEATLIAVAALTDAELEQIAAAAHETARICFTPDLAGPPSDAVIAELLATC